MVKKLPYEQMIEVLKDYKAFSEAKFSQGIIDELTNECYFNDVSFVIGDSHSTAFNEGKRYVLLHILDMISASKKKIEEEKTTNAYKDENND